MSGTKPYSVQLRAALKDVLVDWFVERGEAISMSRLDTLVERLIHEFHTFRIVYVETHNIPVKGGE